MTDCQKSCAGWWLLEVSDEEDGPVYHCGYCDHFLSDCQKSCAGWRAAAEAAAATEAEAEAAAAGSDEDELKRARLDDKEDGPVRRYQCGFCDH